MNTDKPLRLGWIAALMIVAIGYRVFAAGNPGLWNTAPLMAMAFGGGLLLGRRFWWVPAVLLIVSDIGLLILSDIEPGAYTIFSAIFYTLAALTGARVGENRSLGWPKLWLGTLLCSLIFYVAANTFSWALAVEYPKTLAGWWQSQTVGVPGFPPSILFLRNALIGDTIWCAVAAPLFFWNPLVAGEKEAVLSR